MQPVHGNPHAHAGFIVMRDRRALQRLPNELNGRAQHPCRLRDAVLHRARTHAHSKQVVERLRGTRQRQLLILRQIDRCGLNLIAILQRLAKAFRKLGTMHFAAAALRLLHAMRCHFKPDRRQINDLPLFGQH